jgi:hypothetical protein
MVKMETSKGTRMMKTSTAFDPVEAALKQMHHAVSTENMPDDFVRILAEIDAKIAAAKSVQ